MSSEAFELTALFARYVFMALMLIIALRAARITAVDARRAAKLRRLSPMTGLSGELIVLEGDGLARTGMRYTLIREGAIGSARSADVRIRHASVRRRHAIFQLAQDGLHLRGHAGARVADRNGRPRQEMLLQDGDRFSIGHVRLMLVLAMPEGNDDPVLPKGAKRKERSPREEAVPVEENLFMEADSRPYESRETANAFGISSETERRRARNGNRRPERRVQRHDEDNLFHIQ